MIEHHLRRIYLNELSSETNDSIAIGITKLFGETLRTTPATTKKKPLKQHNVKNPTLSPQEPVPVKA
ncbi:hypothetical protein [Nostoc sp. NMS9]|uniref:hypothetical protein n=1 Tax=Nostoc sp. NMS9 TaxID=2815393 RepID=UPI0034576ABB